jgi:hypothetical protein
LMKIDPVFVMPSANRRFPARPARPARPMSSGSSYIPRLTTIL